MPEPFRYSARMIHVSLTLGCIEVNVHIRSLGPKAPGSIMSRIMCRHGTREDKEVDLLSRSRRGGLRAWQCGGVPTHGLSSGFSYDLRVKFILPTCPCAASQLVINNILHGSTRIPTRDACTVVRRLIRLAEDVGVNSPGSRSATRGGGVMARHDRGVGHVPLCLGGERTNPMPLRSHVTARATFIIRPT